MQTAYMLPGAAPLAPSAPVSSVEARQCEAKESAACMVLVVALQQESKTAITGTEPDLMRQSPCLDGSIIGVACLRPCRNRVEF